MPKEVAMPKKLKGMVIFLQFIKAALEFQDAGCFQCG